MWYVYNKKDSWREGWQVGSEAEAVEQCEQDSNLTYAWVNVVGYDGDGLDPYVL